MGTIRPGTGDVIARLVADARPVHRIAPAPVRFAGWSVLVFALAVIALLSGAPHGTFDAGLPLAGAVAGSAALAALRASIPGERARSAHLAAVAALAAWAALLATQAVSEHDVTLGPLAHCATTLALFGLAPGALLVLLSRRAFPLAPRRAAALALFAGAAAGAFVLGTVCPVPYGAHRLVAHLLPVAACALVTGTRA